MLWGQIYRLSFRLRLTAPRRGFPAMHQGVVYGACCAAYGVGRGSGAGLPDGVMVEAPEACRLRFDRGQPYGLGATLVGMSAPQARTVASALAVGLKKLGGGDRSRGGGLLSGNFKLAGATDAATGGPWRPGEQLTPIEAGASSPGPPEDEAAEVELEVWSPLRVRLPKSARLGARHHLGPEFFDPMRFLRVLAGRLDALSGDRRASTVAGSGLRVENVENRLAWLDVPLRRQRKTLGGAVGAVRFTLRSQEAGGLVEALRLLRAGQWTGVGKNTKFGFGRYRLWVNGRAVDGRAGPCPRGQSLLSGLLEPRLNDPADDRWEGGSGQLSRTMRQLLRSPQAYQPPAPQRLTIRSGGRKRELRIPTASDRALQRTLNSELAPALDHFLEASSLAYRKGLGRKTAARRLDRAFQAGHRYAIRADFESFFDRIDHDQMRWRLRAHLQDGPTVRLLMKWASAGEATESNRGRPAERRGLPTGAPISPLLANVFLDRFDEAVASQGATLVRYADDFMVLFGRAQEAMAVWQRMCQQTEALELALNRDKSHAVHLRDGFEFLGFRFDWRAKERKWSSRPLSSVHRLERLHWREAGAASARERMDRLGAVEPRPVLPGESRLWPIEDGSPVVLVGPEPFHLQTHARGLRVMYTQGAAVEVDLEQLDTLVLLGRTSLSASVLAALRRQRTRVYLASASGRLLQTIAPAGAEAKEQPAHLMQAQAWLARRRVSQAP